MDVREFVGRADVAADVPVARRVQEVMLSAIAYGELVAGDVLHDQEWAAAFEASRTPVREAIQHLHGMGLLDVAAARYTRIRSYGPGEALQEVRDWLLLHHAVSATMMDRMPDALPNRLCQIRDMFLRRSHPDHVRAGNFTFFEALRAAATGSAVTLGATAAAYRLRLADPVLSHDPAAYASLHDGIIHALTNRDPDHAHRVLTEWASSLTLAA